MRIGFVDHHLNNYHADKFLQLVRGPLADMGAEIAIAWESSPTGDDWCARNNVSRAATIGEVCEKSDAIMVLAPDNISDHLDLCRQVLPSGKPTAIDKALAFNVEDAKKIVDLARQHNVPITSSSALAFAVELDEILPQVTSTPAEVFVTGMGEWKNYGLHTLSLGLRVMGSGLKRLIDTGTGSSRVVTCEFDSGTKGFVTVRASDRMWEQFPWTIGVRLSPETYICAQVKDYDGFYQNQMKHVIEFFETGQGGFPADLAMTLVRILEGADRSLEAGGEWQMADG